MLSLLWLVAGCRRRNSGVVLFMRFSVSFSLFRGTTSRKGGGGGVSSENGTRARGCEPGLRPGDLEAVPRACAHLRLQPFPHFLGPDPCALPTGVLAVAHARSLLSPFPAYGSRGRERCNFGSSLIGWRRHLSSPSLGLW